MKLNQIIPTSLLTEVFDKGHDWQWTNKGDFEWVAKFTPKGGTEIIVDLAPTKKDGTEIEVNFITKGMGNLKTGAGGEFAVFGTVIDIISHYIKERKPEPTVIQFIARREGEAATDASIENNRAKLYKRIVTRFANKFNYTASWKDIGRITEFYLVRNDVSESGVGRITKQNATKDAPIGSEYQNVDKLFPDHKLDEGYKLQLERDSDMMVLHIVDTATGRRTEVRGKAGYETDGYDANDKLHQLLDKISKTADISELMNGGPVGINPKHPDGASAKSATTTAFNENKSIK